MRWHRRRWSGWGAWLGVIALSINALVPIHFAFDLAEAFEPAHHASAGISGGALDRQLLALICGNQQGVDEGGHHQGKLGDRGCPVCAAGGTLTALAPPVLAALPVLNAIAAPPLAAALAAVCHSAPGAAYRSRAPPLA